MQVPVAGITFIHQPSLVQDQDDLFNLFQVELLHKQLVSLRLEEELSAPLVHSLADPQVELSESFRLDLKAREMF